MSGLTGQNASNPFINQGGGLVQRSGLGRCPQLELSWNENGAHHQIKVMDLTADQANSIAAFVAELLVPK